MKNKAADAVNRLKPNRFTRQPSESSVASHKYYDQKKLERSMKAYEERRSRSRELLRGKAITKAEGNGGYYKAPQILPKETRIDKIYSGITYARFRLEKAIGVEIRFRH